MELVVLRQGFAKRVPVKRGRSWEREGLRQARVRLPSLSLNIYGGKGGGGGALGFPREGAAATGETLDGFGRPHPWETCPPQAGRGGCPRGGAPTSPRYVRGVGRGAQPLSGLVCPLPLAHKAPNACRGLRNIFRSRWSSPGTPRTISVSDTLHPIYRSSPPDHSETSRHVQDLIRDCEQHSVTTYKLPL